MPIEWDNDFTLVSSEGSLPLNTPTAIPYRAGDDYLFLLDHARCKAGPRSVRVTVDERPQDDGVEIHPAFLSGVAATLAMSLMIADTDEVDGRRPACDGERRAMWDTLLLHARALVNPSLADLLSSSRLIWTPSEADDRMLHKIRCVEWPSAAAENDMVTVATMGVLSPYAYEMDAAESPGGTVPVTIEEGFPVIVTNTGSVPTHPVFKFFGPIEPAGQVAQIYNATTEKRIIYDTALPGAATVDALDFLEIDTFRDTVYLDGAGANRKKGIDVEDTDFFTLVPGDNELHFFGSPAYAEVIWNNGWGA